MDDATVNGKGQVTLPKALRQRLGIGPDNRVRLRLVGDRIEMRVAGSPPDPAALPANGHGLLVSRRSAVPADLDPAVLLRRR